jgi:hypothetical protein
MSAILIVVVTEKDGHVGITTQSTTLEIVNSTSMENKTVDRLEKVIREWLEQAEKLAKERRAEEAARAGAK